MKIPASDDLFPRSIDLGLWILDPLLLAANIPVDGKKGEILEKKKIEAVFTGVEGLLLGKILRRIR